MLVTPQVKGTLSFKVRRYVYSAAFKLDVRFYKLTKTDDGFTFDPETDRIEYEIPEDLKPENESTSTTWSEVQTIELGDEYTYIGVRVSEGYVGAFAATSAKIYVPIVKSISLSSANYKEGYTYQVNATEDGKWNIGVTATVKNTSNVPLVASEEENFTISLVRVISTNNPYEYEVLKTVAMPDLELDGEATITIEDEFELPDMSLDNNGVYRFRLDVIENYSGQNKSLNGSWCEVTPYTSILEIRYDKKSTSNGSITETTVEPAKAINYGSFVGSRSMNFKLRNRGAASLTIESIDTPEGVTITDTPTSIAAGESAIIGVAVGGDAGFKEGTITFNTNGEAIVNQIAFTAEVIGEDEFFANFESDDALSEWYVPATSTNWKVADYTTTEMNATENYYYVEYGFNVKRLENTMQTAPQAIYSPLLSFGDNETISFYAAKKSNTGADIKIEVKYSTDRANWIELGTITVTNDDPNLQFSSGTSTSPTSAGQNILKHFSFDMPSGEYYISLGGAYVLIDNFHGGKVVQVDYDIVSETAAVGEAKVVNNPLTFTTSFKNINTADVEADGMVVTLYANDEEVATADGQAIEAGQAADFELSYTPHVAGETTLYAVLSIGDEYSVSSPAVTVKIQNESAVVENTIGTPTTTDSNIPLNTNYNNSKSEFVYTAEDLANLEGTTILKVGYLYYKTGDTHTAETVTIWMQNTEDTSVGSSFTDTNEMTKVMEVSNYDFVKAGTSQNDLALMEFVLDEPFEYDQSKNLRIVIESLGTTYKQAYFAVDKTSGTYSNRTTRYYREDVRSTYENNRNGAGSTTTGMPVIKLYTEASVQEASGTVTISTEDGEPIEGATVRATATEGDVYYEAITDGEGAWSMIIYQDQLTYTVTASAEGYVTSEPQELSLTEPNVIVLIEDTTTGVDNVATANGGEWRYYNLSGIEVKAENLRSGIYIRTNGTATEKVAISR